MKLLVTGGEGLVGRALAGAARARGIACAAPGRQALDVRSDPAQALREHAPHVVIFCAAQTQVDACAPEHRDVNVEAPAAWARACAQAGVRLRLLSSNFVLDGPGPHPPDTLPRPGSLYARQKAEAEGFVRASGGQVVRVGWVYGPGGRTFASTLPARLARGETVPALADVLVQPTWAPDLAEALLDTLLDPAPTMHLIGSAEVSWYGMACAVQAALPGSPGSVTPVRLDTLGLAAHRPRDARLAPALLPGWSTRVEACIRAALAG